MKRIAVIGAGSSGITACKTLVRAGFEVDCFERSERVGGNWVFRDDTGHSSVYRSTYINTSKQLMAYSDFEMGEEVPDYPHHSHIARYFEDYVDHFDFRSRIHFRTTVERVERVGARWAVTTAPGGTREYDAVLVCNGHHWNPSWPAFATRVHEGKDSFSGTLLHSHFYKEPTGLEGKRVLIVGLGNSGVDLSVEISRVAALTAVSVRRGYHILPKYVAGVPLDHFALRRGMPSPTSKVGAAMLGLMGQLVVGDVTRFGLPAPSQAATGSHPTISQEFLPRVGHGDVRIRPDVRGLEGPDVVFAEGSREAFDVVICATGYRVSFPFFDASVIAVRDNRVDLYKHVIPPRQKGLYFIGLIQPLGAIMPIAELQSKWVAAIEQGEVSLPDPAAMERDIEAKWKTMRARYTNVPRHTIQVDFDTYMLELWREMTPDGPLRAARQRLRRVDPFTALVRERIARTSRGHAG